MVKTYQAAIDQMKTALILLDEASAPADVGALLDLAICRLEAVLSTAYQSGSAVTEVAAK